MARALPPLTWFRAFESSARNLSFTAAALELGMTQSAISQQVNSLEKRFGCLLFIRKSRGLILTDEGRRLVPTVAKAISILHVASESFETETDKQLLTIATSVSIAQWYLVHGLKEFTNSYENIAVRLITKIWPDEFSDPSVDVEIRFDSLKSASKNSSLLGSNQLVVVGSPNLVGKVPIGGLSAEEILKFPLIQVVGTSDTWQAWSENKKLLAEIKPSSFVDSHGLAVDLACACTGVALTSLAIAAPSLCDGTLNQLEPRQTSAQDGYHLTILSKSNHEHSKSFATWLSEKIKNTEAKITIKN